MSAADRPLDPFYPIVPDFAWLERIVPLGVRTVQLRLKDAPADEVRRQVVASRDLAARFDCQLIVNDYWREAIAAGCDWVHLGQEDLETADLAAIKAAGIRIGVSTHDLEELAIALAVSPDYIALGPIWETKLKPMKVGPQGLDRIRDWKTRIGDLPLVAIGGISLDRAASVIAAGADSASVITDFFTHPEPEVRIKTWLAWAADLR